MKPCIATICLQRRPVRRHPARPAKLPKPAELDRFGGSRRDRQFGVPLELLAIVEEHEISERLAQIAGRQETDILRQALGEYPDPDLVLHAENGSSKQR